MTTCEIHTAFRVIDNGDEYRTLIDSLDDGIVQIVGVCNGRPLTRSVVSRAEADEIIQLLRDGEEVAPLPYLIGEKAIRPSRPEEIRIMLHKIVK